MPATATSAAARCPVRSLDGRTCRILALFCPGLGFTGTHGCFFSLGRELAMPVPGFTGWGPGLSLRLFPLMAVPQASCAVGCDSGIARETSCTQTGFEVRCPMMRARVRAARGAEDREGTWIQTTETGVWWDGVLCFVCVWVSRRRSQDDLNLDSVALFKSFPLQMYHCHMSFSVLWFS